MTTQPSPTAPPVPAYTAEDLMGDPRLPKNAMPLFEAAEALAEQGWSPADVTTLLDDWPTITRKHRMLLTEASWMGLAMPDRGVLAGRRMPPVVVRAWMRLLMDVAHPTATRLAFVPTPFAEEFRGRRNGKPTSVMKMLTGWMRTTGDPYLAVIVAVSGLSRSEYVARREAGETITVDDLLVLGGLRHGAVDLNPEIIARAKEALA